MAVFSYSRNQCQSVVLEFKIFCICQGGNDGRSWSADVLSMTYIETSLAIMTSTTTRFNWTATRLNCPSRSFDIISRFLLGKISSEAIVVWSTMQRYVQFKSLDKLMVVAVWVSWSNVICHSLTCHLDGNERRNQGLVRKHITEYQHLQMFVRQMSQQISQLESLRSRICCDIKPFISGLSQPVPTRAPSTSGSLGLI